MPVQNQSATAGNSFEWLEWLQAVSAEYGIKILGSVAILLIGRWIGKSLIALLRRILRGQKVDPIVAGFACNIAGAILLALVVIAAIQNLGVPTASFVAVVGAAGLAVGLALQGSLSNFAAGVILILLRPFKQGDFIEGAGTAGTVEEISIFHTVLKTPDNKLVIVPNGELSNGIIVNYSALDTRRLDITFGIAYDDDIDKAKAILRQIAENDQRVLIDPKPEFPVSELGDSSVNLIFRVWVKTPDYWGVNFDTMEKVKKTFDAQGITIPFPQQDVHLSSSNGVGNAA